MNSLDSGLHSSGNEAKLDAYRNKLRSAYTDARDAIGTEHSEHALQEFQSTYELFEEHEKEALADLFGSMFTVLTEDIANTDKRDNDIKEKNEQAEERVAELYNALFDIEVTRVLAELRMGLPLESEESQGSEESGPPEGASQANIALWHVKQNLPGVIDRANQRKAGLLMELAQYVEHIQKTNPNYNLMDSFADVPDTEMHRQLQRDIETVRKNLAQTEPEMDEEFDSQPAESLEVKLPLKLRERLLRRKDELVQKMQNVSLGNVGRSIYIRSWLFVKEKSEKMSGRLNGTAVLGTVALAVLLSSRSLREHLSLLLHTLSPDQTPVSHDLIQTFPHQDVVSSMHLGMLDIPSSVGQGGFHALIQTPDFQIGHLKDLPHAAQQQLAGVFEKVFSRQELWEKLVPGGTHPGIFSDTGKLNLEALLDTDVVHAIDQEIQASAGHATHTLSQHLPRGGFAELLKK